MFIISNGEKSRHCKSHRQLTGHLWLFGFPLKWIMPSITTIKHLLNTIIFFFSSLPSVPLFQPFNPIYYCCGGAVTICRHQGAAPRRRTANVLRQTAPELFKVDPETDRYYFHTGNLIPVNIPTVWNAQCRSMFDLYLRKWFKVLTDSFFHFTAVVITHVWEDTLKWCKKRKVVKTNPGYKYD